MVETQLIGAKELREKAIDRIDVLDKVKKLFLIPEMEVMTTKMVADYYEVTQDVVKMCYFNNKNEINSDGVIVKRVSDIRNLCSKINLPYKSQQGKLVFELDNISVEIPNAGIKVFPKRAVLRIGMLLRDSEVAKQVRTQLLNTFEHSTDEQKTFEIDEEMRLKMNIGIAYANGDMDELTKANMEYNAYKNRYIHKIEEENVELSKLNKELETTNALLTRKAMTWGYKPILNALVRKLALKSFHGQFGRAWNAAYRQIKYKCGYDLKSRVGTGSVIDRIKDDEFPKVTEVVAALCEANGIDVGKTINEINADNIASVS